MGVAKKRAPRFRAGDRVVLLYGPQKVVGEIVEDRGPLGLYGRRLYRVRIDRGEEDGTTFEVAEEDLEVPNPNATRPDTPGPRQEFHVTYVRGKPSNHWAATTRRGAFYQGLSAKGAVGYTTGLWKGQEEEDQGTVTVFMECDPDPADSPSNSSGETDHRTTEQVSMLADQVFKTRHPDAVIDHTCG